MPALPSILEAWYAALRSPSGVAVRVSDRTKAKAALYKARAEALDPNLKALTITDSPTADDELWIVHNGKGTPDAPA